MNQNQFYEFLCIFYGKHHLYWILFQGKSINTNIGFLWLKYNPVNTFSPLFFFSSFFVFLNIQDWNIKDKI